MRKCRAQGRCLQDRKSGAQGEGLAGPTLPTHTHTEDRRRPEPRLPSQARPRLRGCSLVAGVLRSPANGRVTQLFQGDACPRPPLTRQAAHVPTRDPRPWPVGGQQPPAPATRQRGRLIPANACRFPTPACGEVGSRVPHAGSAGSPSTKQKTACSLPLPQRGLRTFLSFLTS